MIYRPGVFGFAAMALAFAAWPAQSEAVSLSLAEAAPNGQLLQLVDDERTVEKDAGGDVEVYAPYSDVEVRGRDVHVEAPFTSVDVSKGVRVQAPFVDIYVPRR